jgi:bleomycin hydrolase
MTTMPSAESTTRTVAGGDLATSAAAGSLEDATLRALRDGFTGNPRYKLAQNAVTQTTVDDVALDRSVVVGIDHTFSHHLDDWPATNQKQSGRCWMFAGLNLIRAGAIRDMNIKDFEFSQNYTLFWDKLERANYFLEAIIESAGKPIDDRHVCFLLDRPLDDGGQWNMFVNVVRKHGLVPKSAMPETESSSNTRRMNGILLETLREGALALRELRANGAPMEAVRAAKGDVVALIHRILCIHLGTPPDIVDWQWQDKDKAFHRDGRLRPCEFADKYVTIPLDEYVCLVHDPRATSPIGRTFTVEYLGNVVGGERVVYLNVGMDVMKAIAVKAIKRDEPVWFGCDVGKMMRRDLGVWDARLFDFATLYDTSFGLDKAARLEAHQTQMTHAMLFTGVDLLDETPRRWRVENSWGDEGGQKGFYTMNDSWFDEHVFEISARRSDLPADLVAALAEEPIVLPPWDPMGSLARG